MYPNPLTPEFLELYADLRRAYVRASQHKKGKRNRLRFDLQHEDHLYELARQIMERTYRPHTGTRFIVKHPVPREVIAADFRERVVHHYVADFINPFLERKLIYDCYSCRVGKGVKMGVDRLEHHIRSVSQNYTRPCYVLKMDISGYFMSIPRQQLWLKAQQLLEWIGRQYDEAHRCEYRFTARYRHVSYLSREIILLDPLADCRYRGNIHLPGLLPRNKSLIYSPEGCGLPIGNLTSQLFSNLYLNDFDHYMKNQLAQSHYGRYVDDFYLVGPDAKALQGFVEPIRRYLAAECSLTLHPHKIRLYDASHGVPFLGTYLLPFRRYIIHASLRRIRQQVNALNRLPRQVIHHPLRRFRLFASVNSFLGFLRHTRSYRLRQRLFAPNHLIYLCGKPAEYLLMFNV
jgi:hypothetical protein